MARRKIEIDIIVNGKMQKATVDAKKLEAALDNVEKTTKKTSKSQGTLDRNLKGTAKATSNGTKEFSKMSQGMGGLVGVYAQIAAATFAVSAAFQFMKDSFEVRNLAESQKSFGAVTGVAYQTLTANIQKATNGMIGFRDAAQTAAIGTAAGLSSSQLERLGTAATNVSLALGRDLTDSFQRLVRGVTKAEPELLDELGIVLRLDPALKAYATSIGKTVQQLSQFEKSQAIATEVLSQAEEKFGKIQQIMDPSAFALQQFLHSFDNLMNSIKTGAADTLIPVFNFLKENTGALIASLSLITLPIIKNILPDFEALGEGASKAYKKASIAAERASRSSQKFASDMKAMQTGEGKTSFVAESQGIGKKLGIETKGKEQYDKMLSRRQLGIYQKQLNDKKLLQKKFDKEQIQQFKLFVRQQEALHANMEGRKLNITKRTYLQIEALQKKSVATFKAGQAMMLSATAKFSRGMTKLMAAAGWVGLLFMVYEIGKAIYNWAFPMSEAEKEAKKLSETLTEAAEAQKTLTEELMRMRKVRASEDFDFTASDRVIQSSTAIASADVRKLIEDYNTLAKGVKTEEAEKLRKSYSATLFQLKKLTGIEGYGALAAQIAMNQDLNKDYVKSTLKSGDAAVEAGTAIKRMGELTKATNQAFAQAAASPLPFANIASTINAELNSMRLARDKIAEESGFDFEKERAAIEAKIATLQNNASRYTKAIKKLRKEGKGEQADVSLQATNNLYFKLFKDLENLEDPAVSAFNKRIKVLEDSERAIAKIQEDSLKIIKERASIQIKQASLSTNKELPNLIAAKNFQQDLLDLKIKEANVALDIAKQNKRNLGNDLDENDQRVKAANAAIDAAEEQVTLAGQLAAKGAAQTALDIAMLRIKERHTDLAEKHLKLERARNIESQRAKRREQQATSYSARRNIRLEEAVRLQAEIDDLTEKRTENFNSIQSLRLQDQIQSPYVLRKDLFDPTSEINELSNEQLTIEDKINRLISERLILIGKESAATRDALRLTQLNFRKDSLRARGGTSIGGRLSGSLFGASNAGSEYNRLLEEELKAGEKPSDKRKRELFEQANAISDVNTQLELTESISNSIKNAFDGLFDALLDGTKSFGEAMRGVMANLLKDMAKAYLQAAAMKALNFVASAIGVPGLPARNGAVFNSMGSKAPGYAVGGIARGSNRGYPVTLHGTEAVVPLPNGKSIPVEMQGNTNSTNNVNVTVNMSGQQSQTNAQGNGPNMNDLGRSIGGLVQQHLQDQMRPGGLLNRQGTQGRM